MRRPKPRSTRAGSTLPKANTAAAAEQDPQSATARFGLGNVLVRQGKMQEAEAAYLAAIKLDPTQAAAHANLGVVYYQQGDMGKAAASFQEALRINAKDAPTLYLLAAVRLQEGKLTDAETLLNQAKDLDPTLPEVYYGLGALYRLTGRTRRDRGLREVPRNRAGSGCLGDGLRPP